MGRHILVVEPDEGYDSNDPDTWDEKKFSIICPEGNGCSGWIECTEAHEVDGVSANSGPYDFPTCPACVSDGSECQHVPWCDLEEFDFHGVLHTWDGSNGWTVPFTGCVVQGSDVDFSDHMHLPPGKYVVEDDWDDTEVSLELIGELADEVAE